ncbi:M14 family metallopeptidase [Flavobacteriaceae bacterium F89]|uniref:M14 family metallopeptidase n=1 Tax=Cerina litoralis TaxID=2874477 RepID=A0AAE3JQI5_9FLAO|nr:M14 family metallopeptidase [Cerina litoralis]MCG2462136.1 M14 family metallopeptidase [Cerina litoralis]
MKLFFSLLSVLVFLSCETKKKDKVANFQTPFEISQGQETATYLEIIDFYLRLAKEFPEINVQTIGNTDSGLPLHMVTFNLDGDFNFTKIGKEKTIVLINNGIHPGESDGIDATMILFRDLAIGQLAPPKNTVLVTIPVYNVGGALNRNATTRTNQNGPRSYGFRGNARNFDLNRDFIKSDTENAKTFAKIFHLVKPDIFVDTHVSNGADYQYTLTHLFTQHNKLGGRLGEYLENEMRPELETALKVSGRDITPYVNVFHTVPEMGFSQFLDSPRYSSGYTALWNTLGMMVETHMLKPYKKRVEGTYQLLHQMVEIAETDGTKIKLLRKQAFDDFSGKKYYPINWAVDTTKADTLNFKGFEVDTLTSAVTGLPRIKYDENRPFTKSVIYRNSFIALDSIEIPKAYVIKRPWTQVMERLDINQIIYRTLSKDTVIRVQSYKIGDYQTGKQSFEGHYPHHGTKVTKSVTDITFSQGDIFIPTNQPGLRYLLETLEPAATDSFFNWNFFDTVLQRKEGFSPYVFEDMAAEMLKNDARLRETFQFKKATDKQFAENSYAQLEWLYSKSDHSEPTYLQYPVYRIAKDSIVSLTNDSP